MVAWRLFHLTKLGREIPDAPCTVFFEEAEWKALCIFHSKNPEPPKTPPTMREAIRMVAKMGGRRGARHRSALEGASGTREDRRILGNSGENEPGRSHISGAQETQLWVKARAEPDPAFLLHKQGNLLSTRSSGRTGPRKQA